jgi:uncharacterized SAM-binding protein YcdF (DUF218 family)
MNEFLPVALVLGAMVRLDGTASVTLRRRAEHAARLFHSGRVGAVLASGGVRLPDLPSEAAVIREICRAGGVPDAVLHLEEAARSTEENILLSAPLIRRLAAGRVLIVTDLWHGPRARLVARRQGLHADLAPVPLGGANPGYVLRATLRESVAYAGYWIAGKGR